MKLTKHEHACMVLEKAGRSLVIDPGSFTALMVGLTDVEAIVITHEHADHWTDRQLEEIRDQNPEARILGPRGVADAVTGFAVEEVKPGDRIEAGPFELEFVGGRHALIHSSLPVVDNVGVLVDGSFYYPGDSFDAPENASIETLAVPVSGPWLKLGETMDFIEKVRPKRFFAAHEMLLSRLGRDLTHARIGAVAERIGAELIELDPGDSTSV